MSDDNAQSSEASEPATEDLLGALQAELERRIREVRAARDARATGA